MVLEQGEIVQFDHPFKLLVKNTKDKNMNFESQFVQLAASNGKEYSEKLFQNARKKYFKLD